MKKYWALFLLLPTALMVLSGAANAQRKNTTSHDIPPKLEITHPDKTPENDCPCKCKHHKKHHKKHHHHHNNQQ